MNCKCGSTNHCFSCFKEHYGGLWQCKSCKKTYCFNEGTTDHPEVCDDYWVKLFNKKESK